MASQVVGFVGPPGWADPSPAEFEAVTGVAGISAALDLGDFDWNLDRIGATEPLLTDAATELVARGASAIGIVGTPFGWAGLGHGDSPQRRNARIAEECGVPVVSAVSGVLDWLGDLGARRVALAATYYDRDWCERWEHFVAARGFDVTTCASMADLGIVDGPLDTADETYWAPTPGQIEHCVSGVLRDDAADAVVVSGAGARTLACHERLRAIAGVPVVSSDLGLYRALRWAMRSTPGPATTAGPAWRPAEWAVR